MAEIASVQVGVKAFVLDHEGRALFMQRSLPFKGEEETRWDIPGGRLEGDGQPVDGLAREIGEETGLAIIEDGPDKPVIIATQLIKREGRLDVVRATFFARLVGDAAVRLSDEHQGEGLWLPPRDALRLHLDPYVREVLSDDLLRSFEETVQHPGFTLLALRRAIAARD